MLSGHCDCRKIGFQVDGTIHDLSHCHCSQCRRVHGAAFATFAAVQRSELVWLRGQESIASYASSKHGERLFCRHCGSSLAFLTEEEPELAYLAMGCVAGAPDLPRGYHIFVGSKAPWHTITDDLDQYDEEPQG